MTATLKLPLSKKSQIHIPFEKFQDPASIDRYIKTQAPVVKAITDAFESGKKVVMLNAPTGCHAKDTEILMFDGKVKKVQNIKIGDKLMGDDSTPRKVYGLHRGHNDMFKIIPTKGESFIVNGHHILSLKRTTISYLDRKTKKRRKTLTSGMIFNMSVARYSIQSNNFKHVNKLYRVPVEFKSSHRQLPLDPYFLGVYLGDGGSSHGSVGITTEDKEIIEYCKWVALGMCLFHRIEGKKGTKAVNFIFTRRREMKKRNVLIERLRSLKLHKATSGHKFIPHKYKVSNRRQRLELLAGLMDTDGSMDCNGYDYISKSQKLANDVVFIARSVGLAAYVTECIKGCQTGFKGTYYRVSISGDCSIVPVKLKRKKAKPRLQKKDVLVTGFKIEQVEPNPYYGFVLDGNHLYCMGDFTVTHNSGKSLLSMMVGHNLEVSHINYICSDKMLQRQLMGDFEQATMLMGRSNYQCNLFRHLQADSCIEKCPQLRESPPTTNCFYYEAKAKMLNSRYRILNTSYLLAEANYVGQLSKQQLTILDEADTLDGQLINFIELMVSESQNKKCGLGYPDHITKYEDWVDWAVEADKILNENFPREERPSQELTPDDKALHSLQSKLDMFVEEVDEGWSYSPGNKKGNKFSVFKPTWLTPKQTEKYLWQHSERFLLVSATLPKKAILCKTLGLDITDVEYIDVGCTFPVENRRIFYRPVIEVTSKNKNEHFKVIDEIDKIINQDENVNVKGIIHSVSYKFRDMIMGIGNSRMITHNSDDKDDVLREFAEPEEPLILVSPSSARGLDCKDDLARFIIWPKVPFLNLGDKQISLRAFGSSFGASWYQSEAAQAIIQGCGRGTRHQADWCRTYVLDAKFKKLLRYFPDWFREAIVRE